MSEPKPAVERVDAHAHASSVSEDSEAKIEATAAAPAEKTTENPYIVTWDGPSDPANPLNWTHSVKLFTIILVSANTFNISLASTIFAPGVPQLMEEFGSNNTSLSGFVVSAYIVSFIFGPLIFAPLSELYGRNIVMQSSNVAFLVCTIICAVSKNLPMFIVFRLLQGLCGSVPLVLGAGTIGDLMAPEHRGKALSGWQLGPLLVSFLHTYKQEQM